MSALLSHCGALERGCDVFAAILNHLQMAPKLW
jgi:hypothetical protein